MRLRKIALAAVFAAACSPAWALDKVSGPATVIDGDTIIVGGVTVRLKGVDAAELGTRRGELARAAMVTFTRGTTVTCTLTGEKTHSREVGYCFDAANVDLNRKIIETGKALACPRYDDRYLDDENPELLEAQGRSPYCAPHEGSTTGLPSIRPSPQVIGPPSSRVVTVERGGKTFRNCAEARAAGAAPLYRGQSGFALHLDRDGDGIACEPYRRF